MDYKNGAVYITTSGPVTMPTPEEKPVNGLVSYNNMVAGKEYAITDVISNVKDKQEILRTLATKSSKGDAQTITVTKGNTVTGINFETGKELNIKVEAVGWASDSKKSAALRVSNLDAPGLRVYYLRNGEIIGCDLAPDHRKKTLHNKQYYLFGDGLAETPERLAKATHLAIGSAYTGKLVVIENPSNTPILNIY